MEDDPLSDWKYLRAIPRRYWKRGGLTDYSFRVIDPWHRPYSSLRLSDGSVRRIPPSATCSLQLDGAYVRLAIPLDDHPALAEAVLELGSFLFASKRLDKYLTAFQAYEAVVSAPDIRLAAVRHGLTHASVMLTRPKTVEALVELFGTTDIDLRLPAHQRAFYAQLGRLLTATDQALARALEAALDRLIQPVPDEQFLHPWQIRG